MSNALVQSAQGLNLSQKRILFAAIAKMGGKVEAGGFIKVSALEYAQAFGLVETLAYRQLKSALRSVYSWRLLELLQQHPSGWIQVNIDDLHNALEIPKSQRSNFGKFRMQTLEPAIKELSEKMVGILN